MTAVPGESQWDAQAPGPQSQDAVDRLSQMVAGNDNLVTQPGLTLALYQGNATPQQAQAVNQFVGGLNTELAVRKAASAGTKINLSSDQTNQLDAMGIDYSQVINSPTDQLTQLKQQLAKQGATPVLGPDGQPETDSNGNVKVQLDPLAQRINNGTASPADLQQAATLGLISAKTAQQLTGVDEIHKMQQNEGFLDRVGNDVGSGLSKIGGFLLHGGHIGPGSIQLPDNIDHPIGIADVGTALNRIYNLESTIGPTANPGSTSWEASQIQNNALAKQLGYDPSSYMSMLAYKARGYTYGDTSKLADDWDNQNPSGKFGWDGQQATTQAELFADDPEKYKNNIVQDQSLTPEQIKQRVSAVDSPEFEQLVQRVTAEKQDLGTDIARSAGIDPVKHPTLFNVVKTGANLAAQMATDPTLLALGAYHTYQVGSVGIKGFEDAAGIADSLTAATTVAQKRAAGYVSDLVDLGKQAREADAAGDSVKLAQIQAKATANPYGGLLSDFMGKDQITGWKPAAEASGDESEFVTGAGKPIDTFDEAVDYIASKGALGRLTGGVAPMEFSTMPGAMSSRLYSKVKGSLTAWSAGANVQRTETAISKYIDNALADPAKLRNAVDNKLLVESLPSSSDAVDLLSGQVLAAENAVKTAASESDRLATVAAKANTDVLAGNITDDEARDIAAQHASSLDATDAAKTQLASAQRAFADQQFAASAQPALTATDALRGDLRFNQLRYGTRLAPDTKLGRLASMWTLGALQRAKVLASRVMNWLPNDLHVDVTDPSSSEDIRRAARTYMSPGDSNLLAMQWQLGTDTTRKTIVQGLRDQVFHAAGLSRTSAGRSLMDDIANRTESYSVTGNEITDRNGVNAALTPGQVQTKFTLPNFGAVHKAAAKIGILESAGKLSTVPEVERLLSIWRLNVLLAPTTATRAVAESWLNAAVKHLGFSGLAAKAVLREEGSLEVGSMARWGVSERIAQLPGIADIGRIYRHLLLSAAPKDEIQAVRDMPQDLLLNRMNEQSAQHWAQEVDPSGAGDATAIANAGFEPHKVTWGNPAGFGGIKKIPAGYERTDEIDGVSGANAYAFTLGAFHNKAPQVTRAALDRLSMKPGADAQTVVDALEHGATGRLMKQSNFGKIYWRDDGTQATAISDEEKELGKQQWADLYTANLKDLISGRNGVVQQKLVDHLYKKDIAPDADWVLDNLKGMNRPQYALRPTFIASPDNLAGLRGRANEWIGNAIQEPSGKAYQWLVERNIQRMASGPLFAAAYGKAKVGLEDYKQFLIDDQDYSEETAERITANKAAKRAWDNVRLMVDDPKLRDQLDVTGRSFFAFSRATTTMLRRWAITLWRDPAQARRLQLAAEGAVNSGMVYKDQSGNWDFLVPASGIAQEVLFHAASHIPGLEGLAKFPVSDFAGNVASIIPGSNNPFQYNTNPIVSIAGRSVASMFPNHREIFDEVDQKLNGSQGEGQGIVATLMPRAVKNLPFSIFGNSDDDRNGILTSAMVGSLYNLYAAGKVPPDGASPSQLDDFFSNLRVQSKSQLFLRAVLGDISPATLYVPANENSATSADFIYAETGVRGLHNEYKQLLNDVGGDVGRATAIWTYLHPDQTVYEQGSSSSMTKDAVLSATQAAYTWMGANSSFINKYKSVAAYFVPEQTSGQQFSEAAWRAQLEDGLREKKTPQEFLNAVRVAGGANQYYAMEDEFDSDLTKAKLAGNTQQASVLRQQWAAWSKQFKGQHQTFAAKTEASPENLVTAQAQLADLKQMVKNGDTPGGQLSADAVTGMVQAWEGYHEYRNSHPGTTTAERAQNAEALQSLQAYMNSIVAAVPSLNDLYLGVFRSLTPQLDYDGTDDSG